MVTITEKDRENKYERFGDLQIGDYYVFPVIGKDKSLFIKAGACYGVNSMNGNSFNLADSIEIIPVKNVTIEYEV